MDQAQTWEEFREASNFSNIPGENMIWADRKGNIGWQAGGYCADSTQLQRHGASTG
jgi:penicillin amidase